MSCFHPIMLKDQALHLVSCGRCIGCRIDRQRTWAIRCMHEAQMHKENCFLTLTYDEKHHTPSLRYEDFQSFMRNLRLVLAPERVRFFMAGEYGETTFRPHYHALLFGHCPKDARPIGKDLYESPTITAIWGRGFASVGAVTYASASYCASYTTKKITGKAAAKHYERLDPRTGEIHQVEPEFAEMSVRPGIGRTWWDKHGRETWQARDGIIRPGGMKIPTPRYYDTLLEREKPEEMKRIKDDRFKRSEQWIHETTKARMTVRERCTEAKIRFKQRGKQNEI